jgi:hypothetical protein
MDVGRGRCVWEELEEVSQIATPGLFSPAFLKPGILHAYSRERTRLSASLPSLLTPILTLPPLPGDKPQKHKARISELAVLLPGALGWGPASLFGNTDKVAWSQQASGRMWNLKR